MYESITYAELKSLPKEQKPDAWKFLKTLYPTQKELAEKLGVSPAVVYNMISRYAKEEAAQEIENAGEPEVIRKPARRRNKAKRQRLHGKPVQDISAAMPGPEVIAAENTAGDTFSISVKKMISGEDARFFLNGIGSTLMKDQRYSIEVNVAEI
jgi:hypothetical protein